MGSNTDSGRSSDTLDQLAKALVTFQKSVPTIPKSQTASIQTKNGGSYSYKFADLNDIWAAIREPLADNSLAVTQQLLGGSDGFTGLRTTIWHESGARISEVLDIPTDGKSAQEVGSQITYYKRYALGAALGISTEEDDDGKAGNDAPKRVTSGVPKASPNKPASARQLALINQMLVNAGYSDEAIQERVGKINSSADASELITKLKEKSHV